MLSLPVTIVQTGLHWQQPEKNRAHFTKLLADVSDSDLVILPEMFSTGFTMKPAEHAETKHQTLGWMRQAAQQKKLHLCGSLCVKDKDAYYNRLYWVSPDGEYSFYNKRHLFRMGDEQLHYTAGTEKIITQINGWKIMPLVCYDLRFPVWSRNRWKKDSQENLVADYDVLIYVANWPEVRRYPWKQLLIARAIENQCYVIGVNRIGNDGNNIPHSGDSVVINPLGEIISHTKPHEESVETILLDHDFLKSCREKFPVGLDADGFAINL